MNKNLNTYTKSELIALLDSKNMKKSDGVNVNKTQTPLTFWDILNKVKIWILSLSIIAILSQVFKKYKSIRALLKIANYIIVTMFGISLFEAFGLGFIAKFLGELKYVFGSVIAYLTDSTFYNYLIKMFNIDEKQSIRNTYKKPIEVDWKAEYEKAERKREWEKWLEKHSHKKTNEEIDSKLIILTILFLGGSIAIWYYGKDALDIVTPAWSLGNLIRRILRGDTDDDNPPNSPNAPDIGLDPDSRSISPEMIVYSSEEVNLTPKASTSHLPAATPAPPAPAAPPAPEAPPIAPTQTGMPSGLLEQITKGKSLRKTETILKDKSSKGTILNAEAGPSNITLDKQEENKTSSIFDKLSKKIDKIRAATAGSDDGIDTEDSPWNDKDKLEPLLKNKDYQQSVLEAIKIRKDDTDIIDNQAESSYVTESKGKEKELPDIKIDSDSSNSSMEHYFPKKDKSPAEMKASLTDIWDNIKSSVKSTPKTTSIGLQPELTPKNTSVGLQPELTPLNELIDKGSKLQTFEDLKDTDKLLLENELLKLKPDEIIDKFKNLPDFVENSYIDKVVIDSIDQLIKKMVDDNPGLGKQELIEKLIQENPRHKNKILSIVSQTVEEQYAIWENKLPKDKLEKAQKYLQKEDLKDIERVNKSRTIDSIKTLKSINRSHSNLLEEIKSKASKSDFNTDKLDDTMNLFD